MKPLHSLALCALLAPAVTLGTAAFAQTPQRTTPDPAQQQRTTPGTQQDRMDQDRGRSYEAQTETRTTTTQRTTQHQKHLSSKPAKAFYVDKLMGADVRSRQDDENIGTVDELVIDNNGKIVAVVVGVGGFLGMGDRDVAISWDALEVETDSDGDTRFFVNQSRDQLRNAPEYTRDRDARSTAATTGRTTGTATTQQQRTAQERQQQTAAATGTTTTQQQRTAQQRTEAQRTEQERAEQHRADAKRTDQQRATTGMTQRTHLAAKPATAFHGDKLLNADLRSRPDRERIGSIDELIIDEDGQIVAVIVGVGGFLGMGQRDVAISWDSIQAETDADGDTRFFVDMTEDQLRNAPEFDRD
jgi:hypothetical protein